MKKGRLFNADGECRMRDISRIGIILAVSIGYFTILSDGIARGFIGGVIQDVGKATGIKPLEKGGKELDNAHRDIKNAVPPYKAIEEGASSFVRERFREKCIAPYQLITGGVIGRCSNWAGRLQDRDLIQNAIENLVNTGLFTRNEFNDIQIRWCPLSGAEGMAPDRGRIYLDTAVKQRGLRDIASLLAHEMTHVRQYRRMGSNSFKCRYSQLYLRCGGCQDLRHPLEREAYEFEEYANEHLNENAWRTDRSTVEVCNTSSKNIYVSLGYKGDDEWLAEGWWYIGASKCATLKTDVRGYIYAFATDNPLVPSIVWSSKDDPAKFCLDIRDKFANPDSFCEGSHHPDYQWRDYGIIGDTEDGSVVWRLSD